MSTFVLVHGSFHGAWCWERVTPRLVDAGHDVRALDLPGHGDDHTGLAELSRALYVERVATAVAAEREPVVLVGHSMGGTVISEVAERVPERVKRLVYLCAFLPRDGQSLRDLAKTDTESALMPALVIDEASGTHWVREDGARAAFYHDCPEEEGARAIRRLTREPLSVVATPIHTTAERFGRVPRDYIECTEDRALGPSLQRRMHQAQPCRVRALPSSHSPFYSMPEALARLLVESA
jgi:pimeloyl-ACP methyl ester carboxylesterase